MKNQTATEITTTLNENGCYPDKLSKSKGIFTAKFSYFYKHGQDEGFYAAKIEHALPAVQIVKAEDCWNLWPKESFFKITFTVGE